MASFTSEYPQNIPKEICLIDQCSGCEGEIESGPVFYRNTNTSDPQIYCTNCAIELENKDKLFVLCSTEMGLQFIYAGLTGYGLPKKAFVDYFLKLMKETATMSLEEAEALAEEFFKEADTDKNNFVSLDEFRSFNAAMAAKQGQPPAAKYGDFSNATCDFCCNTISGVCYMHIYEVDMLCESCYGCYQNINLDDKVLKDDDTEFHRAIKLLDDTRKNELKKIQESLPDLFMPLYSQDELLLRMYVVVMDVHAGGISKELLQQCWADISTARVDEVFETFAHPDEKLSIASLVKLLLAANPKLLKYKIPLFVQTIRESPLVQIPVTLPNTFTLEQALNGVVTVKVNFEGTEYTVMIPKGTKPGAKCDVTINLMDPTPTFLTVRIPDTFTEEEIAANQRGERDFPVLYNNEQYFVPIPHGIKPGDWFGWPLDIKCARRADELMVIAPLDFTEESAENNLVTMEVEFGEFIIFMLSSILVKRMLY
jgi:hypothetical protein